VDRLHGVVKELHDSPCTDEERWHRPDSYAVMKEGRKSALRVFAAEGVAQAFIENHADAKKLSIEFRQGKDIRCESYCQVRAVCPVNRMRET